jgi:hypothetical protein
MSETIANTRQYRIEEIYIAQKLCEYRAAARMLGNRSRIAHPVLLSLCELPSYLPPRRQRPARSLNRRHHKGHDFGKVPNADESPTGTSRCFPFWQEVMACYVTNVSSEDTSGKRKCVPVLEDYYECLHHKKEVRSFPLDPSHTHNSIPIASPTRTQSQIRTAADDSVTGRTSLRHPNRISQIRKGQDA